MAAETLSEVPVQPRLLTYEQAGERAGVCAKAVYLWAKAGKLPVVRFGRSVRIDPTDLQAFIAASKVTSEA